MVLDLSRFREKKQTQEKIQALEALFTERNAFVIENGPSAFYLIFDDVENTRRFFKISGSEISDRVKTSGGKEIMLRLNSLRYMDEQRVGIDDLLKYGEEYEGFYEKIVEALNSVENVSVQEVFEERNRTNLMIEAASTTLGKDSVAPVYGQLRIVGSNEENEN